MPHPVRHRGHCFLIAAALWALAPCWLCAQQAPTEPSRAGKSTEKLPFEALPKVYELRDKSGGLQAVPDFSWEDFMELYQLKNQLAQETRQPEATIDELSISGTAAAGRAELTAVYTITVNASDWQRVALRLPKVVLRAQPVFDGPGDHNVQPDRDDEGYFAWIRAESGSRHRVTLKLLAPLTQVGPESHLRLAVPRALVSRLELQVPQDRAVAKLSEGSTLESAQPLAGGQTRLKVAGIGGECEIAWHGAESQVATLPTILEASGVQTIRVNARGINSEARLSVRSFGGEFDRFQVRLPPSSDIIGGLQAGATLASIDGTAPQGKVYEVRLDKKTAGPVEIRLLTERRLAEAPDDAMLELAGFEVLGAVRQWGTAAVIVEGNLQTLWGPSSHVRNAEELGAPVRRDGLSAGFEYFVQPYSLTARFVPQRTRVRVEPEYVMLVGRDETQLRGKLKYTIRGAKVRALELDAADWEIDQVGPDALVNVDATLAGQANPLSITLLQPTLGEIELTLEAHRKNAQGGTISLPLPRVTADAIAPANLAVLPADNLELAWQADNSQGLSPQSVRPQMKLPERQQDPLLFRAAGGGAKFVSALSVHEQAISTSTVTQLEIDDRETRVEERIAFRIAYEPTDHLTLGVPRTIRADRLNITLEGQRLLPAALREHQAGDGTEIIPQRLALPAAKIGRCELVVSYVVRHERPLSAVASPLVVPLVTPGEGQVLANELNVASKSGVTASYAKGPWTEESRAGNSSNGAALTLSARRALPEVALSVISKQLPVGNTTSIDRAWLQTRLTDGSRTERAVYRFSTNEPRLTLVLPPGADLGSLTMELDAHRITWEQTPQRELIVAVPSALASDHVLELRYHFADRFPLGRTTLEAPQIRSARWAQRLYWQLILPNYEHVVSASPEHYVGEYSWIWSNWFWQRRSTMDETELQSWAGVQGEDDARLPGESEEQWAVRQEAARRATSRYLFSTAGAIEPLDVYTIGRARLVFWASLPLLAAGLVLIYFPWARHPGLLFAAAIGLLGFSLADPDSALILSQAASLGAVLAILAALLARTSARSVPQTTAPVRGSSKAIERSITEMYQRPPVASPQPSTSTNPLLPGATPELET